MIFIQPKVAELPWVVVPTNLSTLNEMSAKGVVFENG
jgi:hypothetical protein